jgi:hypothetical protein
MTSHFARHLPWLFLLFSCSDDGSSSPGPGPQGGSSGEEVSTPPGAGLGGGANAAGTNAAGATDPGVFCEDYCAAWAKPGCPSSMTLAACLENCPLINPACEGKKSFQACAATAGFLFECDAGGKAVPKVCQTEAAAMGECSVGKPLGSTGGEGGAAGGG